MRTRITVVGSLNMDVVMTMDRMPKVGETVKGNSIHYFPGGKGANQAVGCVRLGAEVYMLGAIGSDSFGETVYKSLTDNQVKTDCLNVAEGCATGLAVILHTELDNSIVIIPGANDLCNEALVGNNKEPFSNNWGMEESIRFAVKASTLSVTKFGAQAGMPTKDEVNQSN